MWKYIDEKIVNDSGVVQDYFNNKGGPPALVFHYDSAISLFSLGDNRPIDNAVYGAKDWTWADKYDWMKAIYTDTGGFNLQPGKGTNNQPKIEGISGTNGFRGYYPALFIKGGVKAVFSGRLAGEQVGWLVSFSYDFKFFLIMLRIWTSAMVGSLSI